MNTKAVQSSGFLFLIELRKKFRAYLNESYGIASLGLVAQVLVNCKLISERNT
jgi:hypothetical protein